MLESRRHSRGANQAQECRWNIAPNWDSL